MLPTAINLSEKLAMFTEKWSPKIVAEMEGFQFKLCKLEGDFVWHAHPETDEAFFVLQGQLQIVFRDGEVTLAEGEMLVVPKGVEHKPLAKSECHVMVFEREGTVNTGDAATNELTADGGARI
jgi:mannose-6-phosphate isomerase-like protein (cupin superfamily)